MTDVTALLSKLSPEQRAHLNWQRRWKATARPNQIVSRTVWNECGYLAGRGFGKTRVGAEWLTRAVFEDPSGFDSCARRRGVVDARSVRRSERLRQLRA